MNCFYQTREGIYWWPDGRRYDGEWEDGMRTGDKVFILHFDSANFLWLNVDFTSNWNLLGQGVMYFTTGERYNGTWLRNNMHGTAWWRLTNGKVLFMAGILLFIN